MFFERSASRFVRATSLSASSVSDVSGTSCTRNSSSEPSSSGFDVYPAFSRFRSVNASRLTISVPPVGRSRMFIRSAAGFIATRRLGSSPGVRMSWSEKWIWKPETPGSEPAGARISAGKSGSVERSLPSIAVSLVKRAPVSCIPPPESPAKRMTTWSSCSTGLAIPQPRGIAPTSAAADPVELVVPARTDPCVHVSVPQRHLRDDPPVLDEPVGGDRASRGLDANPGDLEREARAEDPACLALLGHEPRVRAVSAKTRRVRRVHGPPAPLLEERGLVHQDGLDLRLLWREGNGRGRRR